MARSIIGSSKLVRLLTYIDGVQERIGAVLPSGKVLDLLSVDPDQVAFASMQALIDSGSVGLEAAEFAVAVPGRGCILAFDELELVAPLPRPKRLRDCSLFLEHMEKALRKWAQSVASTAPDPAVELDLLMASGKYTMNPLFQEKVLYYNADAHSVSGPGQDVVWPADSSWIDYELEWACIVGRTGTNVSRSEAGAYIFGYTILNDWSARDVQLPVMACNLGPGEGKDFPGGYTLGPVIVTPDEVGDPYALTMTARVNGEEWSRGSTASMHHHFEDAIVHLSRDRQVIAGDVIGSGTVLSGCGFELDRRLSDGDVVELEIERIGVLRNRVSARRQVTAA